MILKRRDRLKVKLDWRYWPSKLPTSAVWDSASLLEHARHWELEELHNTVGGLAQREDTVVKTATVDVLGVVVTVVNWRHGVEDDELEMLTEVWM